MTKQTSFVYKWTHLPTLMWYVGSRTANGCHPDDGYICSSKIVRPLIEGKKSDWVREIVHLGDTKDVLLTEEEILMTVDAKNDPRSFNRTNHVMRKDGSSVKGKKRIYLGDKALFVLPNELPLFIDLGWKQGLSKRHLETLKTSAKDVSGDKNPMYGVKRQSPTKGMKFTKEQTSNYYKFGKRECEHCGMITTEGNHARWHGDNCKHKKIDNDVISTSFEVLGASESNEQQHKGEI